MSLINISNLTFAYEGSYENVFENVSLALDTDWRLGFCGRNGRGKTTFLKLLRGEYEYSGSIFANVEFEYFPFEVCDKSQNTLNVLLEIAPDSPLWRIEKELSKLGVDGGALYRPFDTLSGGEQTKAMLAGLFLKENNFLLIDEPTNHLDTEGRRIVAEYLKGKRGFILVSHDRAFLDGCVDHVLSINKADIEVVSGNFSSWLQNKERRDSFERAENEKLLTEVKRLQKAAKRKSDWSDAAEKGKYGIQSSGLKADRGYVGAKAAKSMKTAKAIEKRREQAVEEKSKLLKNIETQEDIFVAPLWHHAETLCEAKNLSVSFEGRVVFENLSFSVKQGDRVLLRGKNGCGKTSLLKLIAGEAVPHGGGLTRAAGLAVSYVPQKSSGLSGSLRDFARENKLDETLFFDNPAQA